MPKGKTKSLAVWWLVAVILTCYLAQRSDCYRLKKTNRRKLAVETETFGVQEGTIVFGKTFERGSGFESHIIDDTKKSNTSVEDETSYQADFVGWSKGQTQDSGPKDASWKRMGTSLQCAGDQMKFRAVGPGASQFAVEQGRAPPMPLSQVPSTCGYNMQRNSLALYMLVPYDGCNVVQEGGNYVLPMRWQGVPVSLSCPKQTTPAPTTAAPEPPITLGTQPTNPQNPDTNPDGSLPERPSITLPQIPYPETPSVVPQEPTRTTLKKPELPKYPQVPPFFNPVYFFPPPPGAKVAPPNSKLPTNPRPMIKVPPHVYPFYPQFYYQPFPWHVPGPLPTVGLPPPTIGLPTLALQTVPTKPVLAAKPQAMQYPHMTAFHPYPYQMFAPHTIPDLMAPPSPPTTTPTTTVKTTQTTTPTTTITTQTTTPTTTSPSTTTTTMKMDPEIPPVQQDQLHFPQSSLSFPFQFMQHPPPYPRAYPPPYPQAFPPPYPRGYPPAYPAAYPPHPFRPF